jgi:hypothetical protein
MGGVTRQGPPLLKQDEGAIWLATQVASRCLFAAGKLGTSETEAIWFYLAMRCGDIKYPYISDIKKNMSVNAGIFPATDEALDDWARHMVTEVLPLMDGVAEWNTLNPVQEGEILNMFAPKSKRFPARSLEPYYEPTKATRWTYRIPNRTKVAVVSPFKDSIGAQIPKQHLVWPSLLSEPVWNSETTIIPIKAYYSPYLDHDRSWPEASGWRDAVRQVVREVVESGAKLAIIGAGALSLPIAAALKRRGISAIHTGGATQILFGVKGRRWLTHSVISTFFTEAWISPSADEVPSEARYVEGGCYW